MWMLFHLEEVSMCMTFHLEEVSMWTGAGGIQREDMHRTPHAMHIEDCPHFCAFVAEGVVAAARAAPAVRVMVHRRARQPSAPPTAA